jgi:hypothetical protein
MSVSTDAEAIVRGKVSIGGGLFGVGGKAVNFFSQRTPLHCTTRLFAALDSPCPQSKL